MTRPGYLGRPASWRLGVLAILLPLSLSTAACGGHKGPGARAAVVLPPANPLAVSKMVQGVQAAKDPNAQPRAISLLKEAVSIDPNLWEARFDLGVLLASSGDLAGCEEQLAAASKLAPDAQEVAIALGEVRRRRGEHKVAADDLGDFVADHADAIDARLLYVATLRESGQIDKAIEQAREVLLRKPAYDKALAELALSHLAKGERDTAALLAKQAIDINPKSAPAHRAAALIALANGDDAGAFDEFQKATEADPQDTTARINMGVVLLKAGSYAKAEEQYSAILKLSPEDTEAQLGLAAALRGEGDDKHTDKYDQARALLEKVLAHDSHNVAALFNLGILLAEPMKKPVDAAPYFKRFLSEAPSDHPMRPEAERYLSLAAAPGKAGGK